MTDDLKAAIERVKNSDTSEITHADFTTVLALAEIGRLAVQLRAVRNRKPHYDRPLAERVKHDGEDLRAYHEWSDAANAFLAGRGQSQQGRSRQ